jgi:hypothetical protein
MKVFLLALLFFIATGLLAQPLNSGINFNSTYTALGNGATWTGTAEQLHNNFSYACVTVYSNKSGTLKVAESRAGISWKSYYKFSYTAGDTVNNKFWVPIQLPWIQVSYTNASSGAQSVFELTTSYLLSSAMATDSIGNLKMSGTFSGALTIPGVSTSIKQDSVLNLLKLLYYRNYNGIVIGSPLFMAGIGQIQPVRDSLSGVNDKVIDMRLTNGNNPTKVNLTLTNLTGTIDTIRIKTYCVAKKDSSYFNVGWKDRSSGASGVGTADVNESDNSLIIIPANTSRTFESDGYGKVSIIRLIWRDKRGKTSTKLYVSTQPLN